MLLALFFFLWIALAILSLLEFHTSFRIVCSGSVKKVMDNFNSSHIALGSMAMLTIVILTNQVYGIAFHFFESSLVALSVFYSSQHIGLSPPWFGLLQLCFSCFCLLF